MQVEEIFLKEGTWGDDYDPRLEVPQEDRDAAATIAFDYLMEHPEKAASFGVDVELLSRLYRQTVVLAVPAPGAACHD